jgi:hypothetical protein
MSALPPKADIDWRRCHVAKCQKRTLIDFGEFNSADQVRTCKISIQKILLWEDVKLVRWKTVLPYRSQ